MLRVVTIVGLSLLAWSCRGSADAGASNQPHEQPVRLISLEPGVEEFKQMEISGLSWFGPESQFLALLPQNEESKEPMHLRIADRADIVNALRDGAVVKTRAIPVDAGTLLSAITEGYDGMEAIAFRGDTVFVTVERKTGKGMEGYVLQGKVVYDAGEPKELVFDQISPAIAAHTEIPEKFAFEAALVHGPDLLAFYEVNGKQPGNKQPRAERWTAAGLGQALDLASLEYRLTDVTEVEAGRFWAINYQYPGDKRLRTLTDPLAAKFGRGATHEASAKAGGDKMVVERLVEFEIKDNRVVLTDSTPIQLELGEGSRNWEGIVRMHEPDGFLIVADEYTYQPSVLGFVSSQ